MSLNSYIHCDVIEKNDVKLDVVINMDTQMILPGVLNIETYDVYFFWYRKRDKQIWTEFK